MPHVSAFLTNVALGALSYARVTVRCDTTIPAELQHPEILFYDASEPEQVVEYLEFEPSMTPRDLHKMLHDRGFLARRGRPASAGSAEGGGKHRRRSPAEEREALAIEEAHLARASAEKAENDRVHAMHILAASRGVAHHLGETMQTPGAAAGHHADSRQAPPPPNAHRARIFSENLRRPPHERLTEQEIDEAATIAAVEEQGGFIPRGEPESEHLGRAARGAGGAHSAVHRTLQRGDIAATAVLGLGPLHSASAFAAGSPVDPAAITSPEAHAAPPEFMPGFAPPIALDSQGGPGLDPAELGFGLHSIPPIPGRTQGPGQGAGQGPAGMPGPGAPAYEFVPHTEL